MRYQQIYATHRPIGGRYTKTKISLNLVVVFYCYFNVYYSSEETKIRTADLRRYENSSMPVTSGGIYAMLLMKNKLYKFLRTEVVLIYSLWNKHTLKRKRTFKKQTPDT